jgi:hypothetical protein
MKFALTTAAVAALSVAFVFGSVSGSEAAKKKSSDPVATFLCPMVYQPVCGRVNKKKVTFGNACEAKQAGATGVRKGACKK